MYDEGRGVAQDPRQAAALLAEACGRKDANACTILGLMYERGRGVAQDGARAAALFKKACDGNDTDGCTHLRGLEVR